MTKSDRVFAPSIKRRIQVEQLVQVGSAKVTRSEALLERAPEINRKSGPGITVLPPRQRSSRPIREITRLR